MIRKADLQTLHPPNAMPLDDVNEATYQREAEKAVQDARLRSDMLRDFRALSSPEERVAALRKLRGGAMTKGIASKIGAVRDHR